MADENIIKRIPPHDTNAERSVIGSMLMDRDAISEVSAILIKEDFYNTQYGLIFDAMVDLYNEGKPVDEIILGEKLREKGAPDEICGLGFLGDILANVPTAAFAKDYAGIVKDKSYLRKMIKLADGISAKAYEGVDSVDKIMENAESAIMIQVAHDALGLEPIKGATAEGISDCEDCSEDCER